MKQYLDEIRLPKPNVSRTKRMIITSGILLFGFALGVLQKWMDSVPVNAYPMFIQRLDISNYFGRLAVWILLSTIIAVHSPSPLRASVNTFVFLGAMVAGYYLYCNYILGFLPRSYMMIWIVMSFASFFLAYICWYARGKGVTAIIISSGIAGVILAQAVSLTQGFYVYHVTEVITWLICMAVLYRKPREFAIEFALSIGIAFLYQLFIPYYG